MQKQLDESGIVLPDIPNANVDPEKVEKVLRDKCESQNATDAVDHLKVIVNTRPFIIYIYLIY